MIKRKKSGMIQLRFLKQATSLCLLFFPIFYPRTASAQWEAGEGSGVAFPITGYGGEFGAGRIRNIEGRFRTGKGKFAVGMEIGWTRLTKDKNSSRIFEDAKLDIIPI